MLGIFTTRHEDWVSPCAYDELYPHHPPGSRRLMVVEYVVHARYPGLLRSTQATRLMSLFPSQIIPPPPLLVDRPCIRDHHRWRCCVSSGGPKIGTSWLGLGPLCLPWSRFLGPVGHQHTCVNGPLQPEIPARCQTIESVLWSRPYLYWSTRPTVLTGLFTV
jgi:hypothetical protein